MLPSDVIVGPSCLANMYSYVGFFLGENKQTQKLSTQSGLAVETSVKVLIGSPFLQPETNLYYIVKCQVTPWSGDSEPLILLTYF